MALQTTAVRADRDGMAGAGMGLGPAIENWPRPSLRDVPPIESAFGNPVARRGDDEIGRGE